VKTDLEARMADVVHNVIGNPWSWLHDTIMTSRDRLDKHPQAEKKVPFRTWIGNVRSSIEPIPSLHFSNDAALENIRKRAQAKLLKHAVDDLRDRHAARAEVARGNGTQEIPYLPGELSGLVSQALSATGGGAFREAECQAATVLPVLRNPWELRESR